MSEQRFTFVVTEDSRSPASMRFTATLGDYDLDAPMGHGPDAASAIIDWIEMWEDEL